MGGRPQVHAPSDEFEFGYYRLNLSAAQLDEVARKLGLPPDSEFKRTLEAGGGYRQPSDGQQIMVTYKGRYVRITYQQGQAARITPQD